MDQELALDHVDFSSVFPEFNFVHELVDQENSASMIGIYVLADGACGDGFGAKTGPGSRTTIKSPRSASLLTSIPQSARIFFRPVNDGVGQGFLEREFDGVFFTIHAGHIPNDGHDFLHDGIDGFSVRGEGYAEN